MCKDILGAMGSKTHKRSYDYGRKLKLNGNRRKSHSEAYKWIRMCIHCQNFDKRATKRSTLFSFLLEENGR
jgi:hypothetical protein